MLPGASIKGYLTLAGYNAIHFLHSQKLSIHEISRRMNVGRKTVTYNLKRLPPGSVRRTNRTDHKKIAARRAAVRKTVRKKNKLGVPVHNSVRRIASAIKFSHPHLAAGRSTINHDLHVLGYTCRVRPRTPIGCRGEARVRVLWCQAHQELDAANVLFSDEKLWDCTLSERKAWVEEEETPPPRITKQWTVKCHVWACIGVGWKVLVFLQEGTITSASYVDTLKKHFLRDYKKMKKKNPNLLFMQDNAPAHRANATLEWLKDHDVNVLSWPPYSPDLNPLENLWAMMVQRVSRESLRSRADLQNCINRVWDSIKRDVVNHLVLSFANRVKKCIRNRGEKVQ